MKKKNKRVNCGMSFIEYMKTTWINKVFALLILLVGYGVMRLDGDGTLMFMALMFGVPLFFTSKRCIR